MKQPNRALIVNTSSKPITIDGRMIAVGGQEVFPLNIVPAAYRKYIEMQQGQSEGAKAAADEPVDFLVELQGKTVEVIKLTLPDLEVTELQKLQRLEEQSQAPRVGVSEAISAELLTRGGE